MLKRGLFISANQNHDCQAGIWLVEMIFLKFCPCRLPKHDFQLKCAILKITHTWPWHEWNQKLAIFDQMIVESSHVNKYSLFRSFSSCSWRENVETIHFRTSSGTSLPPSSTLPSWFNCMLENNRFLNFNRCYFFENSSIKKKRSKSSKTLETLQFHFFWSKTRQFYSKSS